MQKRVVALAIAAFVACAHASLRAQTSPSATHIADVAFLAGTWTSGTGHVAETGESSHGTSSITLEVSGNALLRRDHVELFKDAKPTGSFDILMMVYPEGGTLYADYTDGTHVIHYTSAEAVPGRSVVFSTPVAPNASAYRLRYDAAGSDTLVVHFDVEGPGETAFHPIATGSLTRAK